MNSALARRAPHLYAVVMELVAVREIPGRTVLICGQQLALDVALVVRGGSQVVRDARSGFQAFERARHGVLYTLRRHRRHMQAGVLILEETDGCLMRTAAEGILLCLSHNVFYDKKRNGQNGEQRRTPSRHES